MACPFFMPVEKLQHGTWMHASRLPLGCGWTGLCGAPGHGNAVPSADELRDSCNLGYAENCKRLPRDRPWDSIRFGARTVSGNENNLTGGHIQIRYVCERNHLPVEHGTLKFDAAAAHWESRHSNDRLQRMAECFLESYIERIKKRPAPPAAAS